MHTPIAEMKSETIHNCPTLDLESDESRCSNHKDELDNAVELPKLIGRVMDSVLCIAQARVAIGIRENT